MNIRSLKSQSFWDASFSHNSIGRLESGSFIDGSDSRMAIGKKSPRENPQTRGEHVNSTEKDPGSTFLSSLHVTYTVDLYGASVLCIHSSWKTLQCQCIIPNHLIRAEELSWAAHGRFIIGFYCRSENMRKKLTKETVLQTGGGECVEARWGEKDIEEKPNKKHIHIELLLVATTAEY